GVSGIRGGGDGQQIPPGIYAVGFCPAFGGGGGIRGSGLRRSEAVQRIVGEGLRTLVVNVVGDAHDVAVVRRAQAEIVAEVHGVAAGRGSLELQGLEASVVGIGEHKAAGERGADADFGRGESALWSIADTAARRTPRPTLWKARVGHPDSTSHSACGPPANPPQRVVGKETARILR